ncbi:inositol hexakisphosphate kinase 3-like [Clavelina lepadiformis]|uniref:inositol hexakisphosphate kinase 3-like n=1 Tax=Clavelina lepadiformis TaxID=159417 RepID=UPI004043691E
MDTEKPLMKVVSEARILEPFVHQVSGRAHMLSLDAKTLCKSLSKREWNFYKQMPQSLQRFTPRLKGILLGKLEEDLHLFKSSDIWPLSNINSTLVSSGLIETKRDENSDQICNKNRQQNGRIQHQPGCEDSPKNQRVFEQTLFKGLERVNYVTSNGFTSHAWTVDKDQEAVTEAVGHNPWALRQHYREINRTLKGDSLRKEIDLGVLQNEIRDDDEPILKAKNGAIDNGCCLKAYLLLEDVTSGYHFPSILDLKIGTQLDRHGCSQEKKDKHIHLVKNSSTGTIGIRMAGMQVYQVNTGQYLCRDKYYGRGLTTNGFKDTLRQFLHNGQRIVTEVIPPIVERLVALRKELEYQETFRFHASSVLITYEGARDGLKESVVTSRPLRDLESVTSRENGGSGALTSGKTNDESECTDSRTNYSNNNKNNATHGEVGVHMIDFAHSTFDGFLGDEVVYSGPDKDCLYALDNLVSVLENIERNAT